MFRKIVPTVTIIMIMVTFVPGVSAATPTPPTATLTPLPTPTMSPADQVFEEYEATANRILSDEEVIALIWRCGPYSKTNWLDRFQVSRLLKGIPFLMEGMSGRVTNEASAPICLQLGTYGPTGTPNDTFTVPPLLAEHLQPNQLAALNQVAEGSIVAGLKTGEVPHALLAKVQAVLNESGFEAPELAWDSGTGQITIMINSLNPSDIELEAILATLKEVAKDTPERLKEVIRTVDVCGYITLLADHTDGLPLRLQKAMAELVSRFGCE